MGLTRFLVPIRDALPPKAAERAYLSGMDDIPWRTRVVATADGLTAERTESESGSFHILWKVEGRGEQVLGTATLVERAAPYILPLELARGALNRIRANVASWQMAGLPSPDAVTEALRVALAQFIAAIGSQQQLQDSAAHAQRSIEASLAAADSLIAAFAEQAAKMRQAQPVKQTILFGGRLGTDIPDASLSTSLVEAFNTGMVPLTWCDIEAQEAARNWSIADGQIAWCQAHQLRIFAGPLLEFDKRSLPDWLYLWEGNFEHLMDAMGQHVKATVGRYKGRVHLWHCAARPNTVDTLALSEEQSLRMTLRAVEIVREVDPKTPVVVSFDQPWAECMSRRDHDLSPLQFADTLVRADLGISGVGLELNLGVGPWATLPRDVIELGRQIERWSTLGIPLVILLTIPSTGEGFSPAVQQRWLQAYLQLFSAKSAVHGVFWNQMQDESSGAMAHRGLVDSLDQPTAALTTLAKFRKQLQF